MRYRLYFRHTAGRLTGDIRMAEGLLYVIRLKANENPIAYAVPSGQAGSCF